MMVGDRAKIGPAILRRAHLRVRCLRGMSLVCSITRRYRATVAFLTSFSIALDFWP